MSIIRQQADVVLQKLANQYRAELQDEENGGPISPDQQVSLEEILEGAEAPALPVVNLASIPVHAWGELKVSKLSKFADMGWDWRQEGSPLYRDSTWHNWDLKLDKDLPLLLDEHAPLVTLLRALLFYWTPQNAVFLNVRSFNSTADD